MAMHYIRYNNRDAFMTLLHVSSGRLSSTCSMEVILEVNKDIVERGFLKLMAGVSGNETDGDVLTSLQDWANSVTTPDFLDQQTARDTRVFFEAIDVRDTTKGLHNRGEMLEEVISRFTGHGFIGLVKSFLEAPSWPAIEAAVRSVIAEHSDGMASKALVHAAKMFEALKHKHSEGVFADDFADFAGVFHPFHIACTDLAHSLAKDPKIKSGFKDQITLLFTAVAEFAHACVAGAERHFASFCDEFHAVQGTTDWIRCRKTIQQRAEFFQHRRCFDGLPKEKHGHVANLAEPFAVMERSAEDMQRWVVCMEKLTNLHALWRAEHKEAKAVASEFGSVAQIMEACQIKAGDSTRVAMAKLKDTLDIASLGKREYQAMARVYREALWNFVQKSMEDPSRAVDEEMRKPLDTWLHQLKQLVMYAETEAHDRKALDAASSILEFFSCQEIFPAVLSTDAIGGIITEAGQAAKRALLVKALRVGETLTHDNATWVPLLQWHFTNPADIDMIFAFLRRISETVGDAVDLLVAEKSDALRAQVEAVKAKFPPEETTDHELSKAKLGDLKVDLTKLKDIIAEMTDLGSICKERRPDGLLAHAEEVVLRASALTVRWCLSVILTNPAIDTPGKDGQALRAKLLEVKENTLTASLTSKR
jgi:hypothetical protein